MTVTFIDSGPCPSELLRRVQLRPEEATTDEVELLRVTGGEEAVLGLAECRRALETGAHERGVDVLRGLLRAAHQGDLVADHEGDHAGEQWVVRASEHEGVDALRS